MAKATTKNSASAKSLTPFAAEVVGQMKKLDSAPNDAYVVARFVHGSALALDDGATSYELAAVAFNAQHLGVAVATVSGTALSFFMSHGMSLYFHLVSEASFLAAGAEARILLMFTMW